jgi:multidrug efflux pump subunit AcrA (membrane-fusion protein)
MNTLRLLAYPFGICLVIATLLGAAQLTGNKLDQPSGAGGNGKPAAPSSPSAKTDGLVQTGTVTAEHDVLQFFLPSHLPAARVADVKVRDGQTVKAGELLIRFDSWQLQKDLQEAEAVVLALSSDYQTASLAKENHPKTIQLAEADVDHAKKQAARAKELTEAIQEKLVKAAQIQGTNNLRSIAEYPELVRVQGLQETAENLVKKSELQRDRVKLENPDFKVAALGYQVRAAEAKRDKAKEAVDRCQVYAEFSGTIERVAAHVGQVVYPQGRQPLFFLVPDGQRLVKVEVVPEFAHKIQGKEGMKVIVSDNTNANLTYEGTFERTGAAFLPKANGIDSVYGKPSNVLEVIVRVTDATPMGKPPLRVGQPVRVTFP